MSRAKTPTNLNNVNAKPSDARLEAAWGKAIAARTNANTSASAFNKEQNNQGLKRTVSSMLGPSNNFVDMCGDGMVMNPIVPFMILAHESTSANQVHSTDPSGGSIIWSSTYSSIRTRMGLPYVIVVVMLMELADVGLRSRLLREQAALGDILSIGTTPSFVST